MADPAIIAGAGDPPNDQETEPMGVGNANGAVGQALTSNPGMSNKDNPVSSTKKDISWADAFIAAAKMAATAAQFRNKPLQPPGVNLGKMGGGSAPAGPFAGGTPGSMAPQRPQLPASIGALLMGR